VSAALRHLAIGAACASLAAVGIFHVWAKTGVVSAGYSLARLEAEHRRLAAERERLRLEVATLRAPGRLERYPRERLGRAPPASGAVVAGGSVGGGSGGGTVADAGSGRRTGPAGPDGSGVVYGRGRAGI
jgi:cell division protein FtsL